MNQSNETIPPYSEQNVDPTIEAYLNSGYDKHIRRARNMLFIISGLQIVSAVILSMHYRFSFSWIE